MIDNVAVGRRIRESRLSIGFTQEQLAEAAGLSTTYISNIERGLQTASLDVFVPICNALNVSADFLLQDVVSNAILSQTNELVDLLHEQPPEVQRIALHVVQAVIGQ